jgi:hypothetical protein
LTLLIGVICRSPPPAASGILLLLNKVNMAARHRKSYSAAECKTQIIRIRVVNHVRICYIILSKTHPPAFNSKLFFDKEEYHAYDQTEFP